MNVAREHHYIPQSILRNWQRDSDKKLTTYSIDDNGDLSLDSRGTPTGKFGCETFLYGSSLPSGSRDLFERIFFGPLDKAIGDRVFLITQRNSKETARLPVDVLSMAYRDPHHYKWLKVLAADKLSRAIIEHGPVIALAYTQAMLESFRIKNNGKLRNREAFSMLDVWIEKTLRDAWMFSLPTTSQKGRYQKVYNIQRKALLLPDYPVFYYPECGWFGGCHAQMSAISPQHILLAGCKTFMAGVISMNLDKVVDLWNFNAMGFVRKRLVTPSQEIFEKHHASWEGPLTFNNLTLSFERDPGPHEVGEYLLDRIPELTDTDVSRTLPVSIFDAQEMTRDAEYVQHILTYRNPTQGKIMDFALRAGIPFSPSSMWVLP